MDMITVTIVQIADISGRTRRGDEMSALETLKSKKYKDRLEVEFCIIEYSKNNPRVSEKAATEVTAMQARIDALETENAVMYAAILEASELGNSAALRCKVELQRIARKEAK